MPSSSQHQNEFMVPKHTASWADGASSGKRAAGGAKFEPELNCTQDNRELCTELWSDRVWHRERACGWLLWPWTWFFLSLPYFLGHEDFLISSATMVIGKAESLLSGLTLPAGSGQLSGGLKHVYHLMQWVNYPSPHVLFPRNMMVCVCVYIYKSTCVCIKCCIYTLVLIFTLEEVD